ncbi:MAG: hypothetical protein Q7R30_20090 [Acidobacteriota bacterium]|nr:hypothetical protein [Acidobacteriota bacterium]
MTISVAPASAQTMDANAVLASIDQKAAAYRDVALKIWSFAELGYQETKSSALLQEQLKAAGFTSTPRPNASSRKASESRSKAICRRSTGNRVQS